MPKKSIFVSDMHHDGSSHLDGRSLDSCILISRLPTAKSVKFHSEVRTIDPVQSQDFVIMPSHISAF